MALLLDVNAVLALGWSEHEAHGAVVKRLAHAFPDSAVEVLVAA